MKRRARRLLVYGFGGGVLAMLPIIGSWAWTYVATLEQAQERVDEVAAQVADNVREVLQTVEEVLLDMSRAANDGCTDELVREMRTRAATLYAMRDIGYVTADGFLVCNSYGRLEPPRSVGSAQTLEPEGSGIIITPPVATVFTPGKSIIIARRLSRGDFVNILVPPELLLRPLKPGVLSSGDSVEVTIQGVTLAALGKRPRVADQLFWGEESVGMLDARVRATADRVLELEKWRQLTLINAAIGGIVGLVVVALAIRLAMRRPSLGDELREALDQNEFIVHYQPVMNLEENRCVGGEALIRWRHPQRGVVAPDVFIALAEETGVIVPMTRWLMNRVGEELGELLRADDGFHVAINLAPIHFVDLDVVTDAKSAAEKSQIPPKQMLFEITERGLIDCAFCREVIEALADLGSRVAIDDFGTGYSNLAYIGMFRLHFLKIDKAFVKTIGSGAASAGLAQVIVDMAHALGLKIIAEGVETLDQVKFLRERGVHLAQGWYFSRPLPGPDFVAYVQKHA